MKKHIVIFCALQLVICGSAFGQAPSLDSMRKSISDAQDEKSLAKGLESAGDQFLKEHKYAEYIAFLRSVQRADALAKALINYYVGQTRLAQLKFLEESQQWEDYFNQGAGLRKEVSESLAEALKTSAPENAVTLYSQLLLWQFHKDQQDSSQEGSMTQLLETAKSYAEASKDPEPLKRSADVLLSYDEKQKAREIYGLYFKKITASGMTGEQLFAAATGFLKEGNIELAESAFTAYVEKAEGLPKEQAISVLLKVAGALAFRQGAAFDTSYAEQMFAAAETAGGPDVFDEETLYLRALNSEAGDELGVAARAYEQLAARFAQGKYRDEALFKAGVMALYAQKDIAAAEKTLGRLVSAEPPGAFAVPALYRLGLIKQWQQDTAAAKQYYTQALEKAAAGYPETSGLVTARLKEIEESKPIDFALKSFLDAAWGEGAGRFDMSRASIQCPSVMIAVNEQVAITSSANPGESGCTQVVLSQYWSGDLGSAAPGNDQPAFSTSYAEAGVKVVQLLVMSPSGVVDKAIKVINVK